MQNQDTNAKAKGCTSIEKLNQLIYYSINRKLRMSFFYNPPNDHQIYHITCEEFNNEKINDVDQHSDHSFYHRLDDKNTCQVTCILIPNTLIAQYLNKNMLGIELKQAKEQQVYMTFSNTQRNNLEYHLRACLFQNKKPNVKILD